MTIMFSSVVIWLALSHIIFLFGPLYGKVK